MGMAAAANPKRKKGFKNERLMIYQESSNVKVQMPNECQMKETLKF
jgi:hypothetical protein